MCGTVVGWSSQAGLSVVLSESRQGLTTGNNADMIDETLLDLYIATILRRDDCHVVYFSQPFLFKNVTTCSGFHTTACFILPKQDVHIPLSGRETHNDMSPTSNDSWSV